jgi:Xaa-Pro aminopeptidase
MLADLDLTKARLAVFGKIDAGTAYAIFSGLESALPGLTIVGQVGDSLLLQAMATKEEEEVERIRRMGKITTQVVGNVSDFLTSHKVLDGVLLKSDGNPLTIADVKSRINLWLAEQGAENPRARSSRLAAMRAFL